mmetsp:Transcript_77394/g.226969  ORF Transcript_77394/g.226969 Transcript_77394/m.226969 type:complete len:447 (-) Transcript_77394:2020-3360(-)
MQRTDANKGSQAGSISSPVATTSSSADASPMSITSCISSRFSRRAVEPSLGSTRELYKLPDKRPDRRMSRRSWALSLENLLSCPGLSMFFFAQVWAAASPRFSRTPSQARSAFAAAKASDHSQNSFILARASSRWPWTCRKGDRPPETVSNAAVGPGKPRSEPSIAARPSCGSSGSRAMTSPTGSKRGGSPSSNASMASSSSIATSTASAPGGSGASARNPRGSRPRAAAWRQLCARSHRCISGDGRSGARFSCSWLYNRRTRPSRTRPARPRRCTAELTETRAVPRDDMRRRASYVSSRCKPASTTTEMSSMVTELSAILVPRMTLTLPFGAFWNTFCCCSFGRVECSGKIHIFLASAPSRNLSLTCRISAHPGRKQSMESCSGCLSTCGTSFRITASARSSNGASAASPPHRAPLGRSSSISASAEASLSSACRRAWDCSNSAK